MTQQRTRLVRLLHHLSQSTHAVHQSVRISLITITHSLLLISRGRRRLVRHPCTQRTQRAAVSVPIHVRAPSHALVLRQYNYLQEETGSVSSTWQETYVGVAGVIRRFWVLPNPEIDFRPLSIHKLAGFGNECAKLILFERQFAKEWAVSGLPCFRQRQNDVFLTTFRI